MRRRFNISETENKHEICNKRLGGGGGGGGGVGLAGTPLGSSVSTKALVFQYTVTETADTVAKCLCRAGPKPLRLR